MIAFAYGSNMDQKAMALRCPKSKVLGAGRLMGHRLIVMEEGYASIVPERNAVVHGVIYDLAPSDVAPLDRYEEVARGLYRKAVLPVLKREGGSLRAMVYVGQGKEVGKEGGLPQASYWQPILDAAEEWAFPEPYLAHLRMLGGKVILQKDAPQAAPAYRAIKLKGL